MLILFDIDGTMLSSEGVGVRSIEETCSSMFGKPCSLDGIQIGGRLDPLIWNDVCHKYSINNSVALHGKFQSMYTDVLKKNIKDVVVKVFPGINSLIETFDSMEEVTLGIVTGNYEETGRLKLEAAGIDASVFVANAWGTDGQVRHDLPPIAIKQRGGGEPVVLIGDTVHDVTSGLAAGCRVIAVCTGTHDSDTLAASEPNLLLEDLSDTEQVLQWIFNTQTQSS